MIYLLPLYFMLSSFTWIKTGNGTGGPSDVLVASLALCVTIIYILNCSPSSTLTKALLLVNIEDLIVYRNGHRNMVLHATRSPKVMETVTGFTFTKKGICS